MAFCFIWSNTFIFLYSASLDEYYVGRTSDLVLRLKFHNEPIESRKFTAKGIPWQLKASFSCQSLDRSIKLEKFIKRMKSRKFIEELLADPAFRNDLIKKMST